MSVNRYLGAGTLLLTLTTITGCTTSSAPSAQNSGSATNGFHSYRPGELCSLLTAPDASALMKSVQVTEPLIQDSQIANLPTDTTACGYYTANSFGDPFATPDPLFQHAGSRSFVSILRFPQVNGYALVNGQDPNALGDFNTFGQDHSQYTNSEPIREVGKMAYWMSNPPTNHTSGAFVVLIDPDFFVVSASVARTDEARLRSAMIALGATLVGRLPHP